MLGTTEQTPASSLSTGNPLDRRREWWAALVLCLLSSLLRLLWPGDTQWINDEPLFLMKAAELNRGPLSALFSTGSGLHGTVGLTYGPVAVWIFAGLLRISDDLLTVAMLRTALWSALTCTALLWLGRLTPRLRPLPLCLVLLSPYAWLYSRHLWDNTWLMPLSSLALAAYGSFHAQPRSWKFALAVLSLALAVLIHPMVAPLCLVLFGHTLRFHRDFLRQKRALIVGLAGACLLLAAPWLSYLLDGLWQHLHGSATLASGPPPPPADLLPPEPAVSFLAPFVFPFLGGVQLSAQGLSYFVEPGFWQGRPWMSPIVLWTWLAHGLVWLGLACALKRVRAGWTQRQTADLDFHLALLALSTFAVQALMHAVLRRHTHPHYYNGSWICFVYFAALSLSSDGPLSWMGRLWRPLGRGIVGVSLGLALGLCTWDMVTQLHRQGGTRGLHFGATLENQIDIARKLAAYPPQSPLTVEVLNYRLFPHALSMLRKLCRPPSPSQTAVQPLRIRYRDVDPASGFIVDEPL